MKFGIFTDPHLGLNRVSHSTSDSRKRLRQLLYENCLSTVRGLVDSGCEKVFCLGDLFDTFSNDEPVLLQGLEVLKEVTKCLAGNHDIENRAGSVGSLQALAQVLGERAGPVVFNPCVSKPYVKFINYSASVWAMVPHAITQELFCESLQLAYDVQPAEKMMVLCLHCNVGVPGYAEAENDATSLYLTDEWQERLLTKYDQILVGHEHVPRTLHGGKLLVLGNTHPLSFGEVADRYSYVLDDEKRVTTVCQQIFSAEDSYTQLKVSDILEAEETGNDLTALVEIIGQIKKNEVPALSRALAKVWRDNPEILLLKNSAEIEKTDSGKKIERQSNRTLSEVIYESVEKTSFKSAYLEAVQAVADEGRAKSSG